MIRQTCIQRNAVQNTVLPADDPLEQLKKLNALKDAGVISEEEFNEKKAALLAKI